MISEQRVISEGAELINQRIFKLDSFYQLNTHVRDAIEAVRGGYGTDAMVLCRMMGDMA